MAAEGHTFIHSSHLAQYDGLMNGSLLTFPTLIAPLEGHTLVQVIHPIQFFWSTTMALPPTTDLGSISPYFMASVGHTLAQYPHLTHVSSFISLWASSVPEDMSCIEPVLHALTHAPHCLHSLVLILGTFSLIGSERVVSILIASYGHASRHITHPTHLSSISIWPFSLWWSAFTGHDNRHGLSSHTSHLLWSIL